MLKKILIIFMIFLICFSNISIIYSSGQQEEDDYYTVIGDDGYTDYERDVKNGKLGEDGLTDYERNVLKKTAQNKQDKNEKDNNSNNEKNNNDKTDIKYPVSNTDTPNIDVPEPPPTYSISGKVWEDTNKKTNEYSVLKGDGIFQEGENLIEGITVNLYKEENNNDIISTTTTDSNGSYTFEGVEEGKYKVDFVYGKNPNNLKYNGQDYKSTLLSPNTSTKNENNKTNTEETIIETNEAIIDLVFVIDHSSSMNLLLDGTAENVVDQVNCRSGLIQQALYGNRRRNHFNSTIIKYFSKKY